MRAAEAIGDNTRAWSCTVGRPALQEAHLPKSLLKCKAISKEITFSSVELMDKLRLVQVWRRRRCPPHRGAPIADRHHQPPMGLGCQHREMGLA